MEYILLIFILKKINSIGTIMDIIYHNLNTTNKYQLKSKQFQKTQAKKSLSTALPISAIKVTSIDESSYINEEEFIRHLSVNAYDILELDKSKAHIIKYLKSNNRYRIFSLEKESIDISKYTYITYEPLSYQSLYDNTLITRHGIDCFIKIRENNSFITLYRDGEYLDSRCIDEYLHETLFTNYDLSFIKELLVNYNSNISKLIASMLESITSLIVLESKSVEKIYNSTIDRIFIDFDISIAKEYFVSFKEHIDSRIYSLDIDTLGCDTTTAIYTSMLVKNYNHKLNFITNQKPANNTNYISKSAASIIVASAISLAYPLYLASEVISTKIENISLNNQLKNIEANKQKLLSSVQRYVEYKSDLQNRLTELKSEKKEILTGINDMYKGLDNKKADILAKISDRLNITDVSIDNISLKEKNGTNIVSLSLLSDNRGKIDFVIKELAYLDFYRKSVYKYNNKYIANIEVII
jgi:hypothetical protein